MIDADNLSSEVEQTDGADTGAPDPTVVARAREMGWVPEAEWKGAPPKNGFLDPAEFVRRGDKIMPIVRAENKKLQERIDRMEREREQERAEHKDTIKRIERMSALGVAQARQQIEEKYAARIDAAAEVGDKEGVRQARKEEKEAIKAMDDQVKDPAPAEGKDTDKGLPKAVIEILDAWKADNKWFTDDPSDEMTAYATAVHLKLQKEKKGLSLKENLEEVSARVRKRFPEEFGDSGKGDDDDEDAKPRGSRVEGGSRQFGGGGSASLWSKLPADAKAQADKFIKEDGLFLNKGETVEKNLQAARERYAKEYLGDDK